MGFVQADIWATHRWNVIWNNMYNRRIWWVLSTSLLIRYIDEAQLKINSLLMYLRSNSTNNDVSNGFISTWKCNKHIWNVRMGGSSYYHTSKQLEWETLVTMVKHLWVRYVKLLHPLTCNKWFIAHKVSTFLEFPFLLLSYVYNKSPAETGVERDCKWWSVVLRNL